MVMSINCIRTSLTACLGDETIMQAQIYAHTIRESVWTHLLYITYILIKLRISYHPLFFLFLFFFLFLKISKYFAQLNCCIWVSIRQKPNSIYMRSLVFLLAISSLLLVRQTNGRHKHTRIHTIISNNWFFCATSPCVIWIFFFIFFWYFCFLF